MIKRTLCFIVAVLLVTGCRNATNTPRQDGQPDQPTRPSDPVTQTPLVDLTTEIRASKAWKIAFLPKEKFYAKTGNLGPYWQPAWEGAKQAGRDLGIDVELVALNTFCETDADCVEPQIQLIAGLIEHGNIDGMIVAPLDSNRLAPVVDKAIVAGIPVIAMDTPVNSDRLLTFVAFDNASAGMVLGQWIVKQLGGKGNALILEGPADQQNAVERRNGFLAGLQGGDIDILDTQPADWEIEPAQTVTAAWLEKFAHVDAILAANDDMALGAIAAAAQAGRQDIIITGFDATEAGLAAIEAKQMSATIDQAPGKQARLAIQLLVRHLETDETFPPIILMPETPLVTQQNIRDYHQD